MDFRYSLRSELPPLAWVARLRRRDRECLVIHGRWVEVHDAFFFEGAWAGEWEDGRPDATEVAFGSGACRLGSDVCFVASLATTDYLFYHLEQEQIAVANSLAFLLASIGDVLNPRYREYAAVNNSVMEGIHCYERNIPTMKGGVRRLMSGNLLVQDADVQECAKSQPPHLTNYQEYVTYLRKSYAALVRNARSDRRRVPLKIFSTQSTGYDSTAVNAIAVEHGLDGVFTVRTGKGGGSGADNKNEREVTDDGTAVAKQLKIGPVIGIDRRAFAVDFDDELLFLASIHESQDANLKQIATHIATPALLLTGTLGEIWYTEDAWYREHRNLVDDGLRRADLAGHGLTEVRLRAGYVQAAIPYIGARQRADILRITEGAEMDPWRLGTSYDRPIARRIAEESGVARASFGQRKIGSVVEFAVPQLPQSKALRERYLTFLRKERLLSRLALWAFPLVRHINEITWYAGPKTHRWVYYTVRVISKLRRRDVQLPILWNRFRGTLFCFAVNALVDEYRRQLLSCPHADAESTPFRSR